MWHGFPDSSTKQQRYIMAYHLKFQSTQDSRKIQKTSRKENRYVKMSMDLNNNIFMLMKELILNYEGEILSNM